MSGSKGRSTWVRVDGVLLLDKPTGLTSNVALQRVRRLFSAEKAGHTGTLDPLASGLLPVCFGEATKFAQSLLDAPKRYLATIRFGTGTATGDAEGEIIERGPEAVEEGALRAALGRFVGTGQQVPPRYAALKHEGRAYYEYARKGLDIPRAPRTIEIHALDLIAFTPAQAVVHVACSKGTYVRVIAEDLGRNLGTCAHLAALRRTATGHFDIRDAVGLEAIEALDPAARSTLLQRPDALIASMPRLDLDAEDAEALRCGRTITCEAGDAPRVRAYDPADVLVGVLERDGDRWRAQRLMRTQS